MRKAATAEVVTTAKPLPRNMVKLVDKNGNLFEIVTLSLKDPEVVVFADRAFLPTKDPGVFREARFDFVPLPQMAAVNH